jgi:NAD(P)-dependent dehydrogenase (short-subunit alcohol dehydrogenase family)
VEATIGPRRLEGKVAQEIVSAGARQSPWPALFLASSDSDFVTGQSLLVDGGFDLH